MLISFLFMVAMNTYNHDEEQYVFAALLATHLSLYKDFVYLQTPYYPLLLSQVFKLSHGYYYLLSHIVTWTLSVAAAALVFVISRRLSRDVMIAFLLTVLFIMSPIMLFSFSTARNDIMPCFFMLLSLWFTYKALTRNPPQVLCLSLSGLFAVAAMGTKVTYLFVPVAIFIYLLFMCKQAPWSKHLKTVVLPFLLGGLVGGIPLFYYALTSWDAFFFDNYLYHMTASVSYHLQIGDGHKLRSSVVLHQMIRYLLHDFPFMVTLSASALIVLGSFKVLRQLGGEFLKNHGVLFIILLAVSIPFCLLPRPTYIQ